MSELAKQSGDATLTSNLRRLVIVRLLAIAGESAAVVGAVYGLKMPLPLLPLAIIIAIYLILNLVTWLWLRRSESVAMSMFFFQLCLDVLILSALLYFAGGATNPFVSLLLLPLVVAATILPKGYVWGMAVLVAGVYAVLMMLFQPLPSGSSHAGHDFNLHVLGMWFGFLLAVAMIVFFVLRMAESLRERDQILSEARERAMRDEKLVALGTLAAGAAHELGTPLSTMAVLSKDLEQEYADDADLAPRLAILQQQVKRCKETLSMISASAGQAKAGSGGRLRLDDFLNGVIAEWRLMRPHARLHFQGEGVQPAPWIVSEEGLSQAIITFLNNAADSSPDDVEMTCEWHSAHLQMNIADRGAGIPEEYREQVGKVSFTTKAEGHGLGLLLAHAIIERLGGHVSVQEREGGGACVSVDLNLEKLLVDG